MKWDLLETNQCPKCQAPLQFGINQMYFCSVCDFAITDIKFRSLRNKIILDRQDRERESLK